MSRILSFHRLLTGFDYSCGRLGKLMSRSSSSSSTILWSPADMGEEEAAVCWNVLKANCGPIHSRRCGPKCVRISTWMNE